jgi:hypothetical protein
MSVGALAIAGAGPGAYSVDRALGHAVWGGGWAVAAAVVGLVAGAVVLAGRARPVAAIPETRIAEQQHRRAA